MHFRRLLNRCLAAGAVAAGSLTVVAPSASAAVLNTAVNLGPGFPATHDGTPSFFDAPPVGVHDPGDDLGPYNRIVRTLDETLFQIDYVVATGSPAADTLLVVDLSNGVRIQDGWVPGASTCPAGAGGFSINFPQRTRLTCHTGPLGAATTNNLFLPVVAPMSVPDGSTYTVTSTFTEIGNPTSATAVSMPVTVSAAPRFELVKESAGAIITTGPNGGPGGQGIQTKWVIGIRGAASDPRGLSALTNPIVLTDLTSTDPAVGVWLDSCAAGFVFSWPEPHFFGPVDTPLSQINAPNVTCTQGGGPSTPITIIVGGIDWDRASPPPTVDSTGAALPGSHTGLVAFFVLSTWSAQADVDIADGQPDGSGSLLTSNAVATTSAGRCVPGGPFSTWSATGVTSAWMPNDIKGNPNLGGGHEPVGNNGACSFQTFKPAASLAFFGKGLGRPPQNGAGVPEGSTTLSGVSIFNPGPVLYPAGAVLCDKWDNSRFGPAGPGFLSTTHTGPVTIEYGTGPWGAASADPDPVEWSRQTFSDCSDSATLDPVAHTTAPGTWFAPSNVDFSNATSTIGTANADDINMVRITVHSAIPSSQSISFVPEWINRPGVPFGEEHRNYAAGFLPHTGAWTTSTCTRGNVIACPAGLSVGESAGDSSHWWTTVGGSVETDKRVVGPTTYNAGDTVTWQVLAGARRFSSTFQPSPIPSGATRDVVLRDILPVGLSFVPGSVTAAAGFPHPGPTTVLADTPNPGETTLEWDLGTLSWPASLAFSHDFTFDAVIDSFSPPGQRVNEVIADTPDDPRPYGSVDDDIRRAAATISILRASRAAITKEASPATVRPGGTVLYTLRYGNPGGSPVDSMDAIDILPFDGDARGSRFGSGTHALVAFTPSGHGEVAWASRVPPASLDAADGSIDGFLDPASASALGSTEWPCLLSDVATPACPAIGALAEVTAVRLVGRGPGFLPAGSGPHAVIMGIQVGAAAVAGDSFANSWVSRFEGLVFPVYFDALTKPYVVSQGGPGGTGPGGPGPGGTGPNTGGHVVIPKPPRPKGMLALTGANVLRLLRIATLLIAVGGLALTGRRRGRRVRHPSAPAHTSST